jgi:hypothetical protein
MTVNNNTNYHYMEDAADSLRGGSTAQAKPLVPTSCPPWAVNFVAPVTPGSHGSHAFARLIAMATCQERVLSESVGLLLSVLVGGFGVNIS